MEEVSERIPVHAFIPRKMRPACSRSDDHHLRTDADVGVDEEGQVAGEEENRQPPEGGAPLALVEGGMPRPVPGVSPSRGGGVQCGIGVSCGGLGSVEGAGLGGGGGNGKWLP